MDITKLIDMEKLVAWRRHLHMYPEVAFHETETAKFIEGELKKYPGVEVLRPAGNAVIGVLRGGKPGKTVGLRADFDALPITEEADVEFKSKNVGIMHACGHDCHTAMLLGALDALYKVKDELCGTVKFIFQHAEELIPGGAKGIVDSGVLNDVSAFYASHVFTESPVGSVKTAVGPVSANSDRFTITVIGKGTHAAKPETGIDSLLIGAEIVQGLNYIVSRNVSSFERAVVTVGTFKAGTSFNIIPHTAEIMGTVRTFNPNVQNTIEKRVNEIANGISGAYGARCEIQYERGYASIINDEDLCRLFHEIAAKTLPDVKVSEFEPMMGGEDFSAYGAIAPTLFASIGAGPSSGEVYMVHHPKFVVDEDALPIGAALYAAFALEVGKG